MIKKLKVAIVWFRSDLRLSDNPALIASAKYENVLPIFILSKKQPALGKSSFWWLHHSLKNLSQSLDEKLNFYVGNPHDVLLQLQEKFEIQACFWNSVFEPEELKSEKKIQSFLTDHEIFHESFSRQLLWHPEEVLKKDKTPYKVFTAFFKYGCLGANSPEKPKNKPRIENLVFDKDSLKLEELELDTSKDLAEFWQPGENYAHKKLSYFLKNMIDGYAKNRDLPGIKATSMLSPHLHFGEISPQQVWHAALELSGGVKIQKEVDKFLSELGWREFAYHLLYHFPKTPNENFVKDFDNFAWEENPEWLKAWKQGKTGYPIVDAGMRELALTGYMHNRVRMIVASFLVKNLLIHWRAGEKWFWECLVDADLASNTINWQWVAGCGVDAAPYFRIFNPVLQGEKFDKEGHYTKKYVPELEKMPSKFLHKPWLAPKELIQSLNIKYCSPIVDLAKSRKKALDAYKKI